ncbi:hypothetical protein KC345_g9613 [Hortaea werneckii]|nr:hypothetical protein KC345_g9613 [Hortaea werneckii]
MKSWTEMKWREYASAILKIEINGELAAGGMRKAGWPFEEILIYEFMKEHEQRRLGEPAYSWGDRDFVAYEQSMNNGKVQAVMAAAAERLAEAFAGRSLLQPEAEALVSERLSELAGTWLAAVQLAHLQGRISIGAAVGGQTEGAALRLPLLCLPWRGAAASRRRGAVRCLRCGSVPTGRTACAACGLAGCAYCEACLALGRSRACALLLSSAPLPAVRCTAGLVPTVAARRWGLSAAQADAAAAALGFLAEPRERSATEGPERFLLWAVTGAGKTEITFPLLEAALAAGGRVLIASPRRDVVLELAPRLAKAFPAETLAVLYGGSADRWSSASMTLATTHQLLRFNQAFDLVIIDELDAYPYHNDPMLAYAAEHACKPAGSFIYLSATPPRALQRLARSGRLPHARVPVRFHGHPLPEPQHLKIQPLHRCLKQGTLPASLLRSLHRSLVRKAQIFLFVPRIAHITGLLQLLRRDFPGISIEGTSSKDPGRAEKVLDFRRCAISILVTTTILERGVTVPHSDVFILDAASQLFDEAALVQMAGRAGRSKDDPAGTVIFASAEWSRSQRGAIAQIRSMNAIARRQGYL